MKRKWLKYLVVAVAVIAVVAILAVVALVSNLDDVVRQGVERSLSYVLQVDVTLREADVSVSAGRVTLRGLRVGNPDGYKTDHAFAADTVEAEVDVASFAGDEPIIRAIRVRSPHLTYEQRLREANLTRLIKNARRFEKKGEAPAEAPPPDAPEPATKPVKIEEFLLDEGTVSLSAPVLRGRRASVDLPRVEIRDLTDTSDPVPIATAIARVLVAVVEQVAAKAGDVAPDELVGAMNERLDEAQGVARQAGRAVEKAGESLGDGIKKAGDPAGKAVEKGVRKVEEGVGKADKLLDKVFGD